MNQQQRDKQVENKIKAFVFSWYSRFDNGTSMEEIKPFLPDETVEFVYPTATLNSVPKLVAYAEQTFAAIQTSAHDIDEIHVFKTAEDGYEVICPHTYHARQADGNVVKMDFIGA